MKSNSNQIQVKKEREFSGHKGAIYALTWDTDLGLISGGGDGWIVNWDQSEASKGNLLAKNEARIFGLASIPNGLLAGTMNGQLIFLEKKVKSFSPRLIQAHSKGLFCIEVFDDFFITGGGDGYLCKWSFDGEQVDRKWIASNSIRNIQKHPMEDTLSLSCSDGNIHFVNAQTLEAVIPPYAEAHIPSAFCSIWSEDGGTLISGGRDALLKIWSYPDFQPKPKIIQAHLYTINAMAQSPNTDLFATASRDRSIKIWDRITFALLKVIDTAKYGGHTASVNNLFWNEQGLFSASDDRNVIRWSIERENIASAKTDKTIK